MATAQFTDVIEELQESNLIEGETLNTALDLKPLFEEGFLFVGEMIEELKLSLGSMQPATAAMIASVVDDSNEVVAESNDDVVAAEEETQKIMKSGLALIGERLGGILGVFKKRDRDKADDDLQEGEDAREAAKLRLKETAKKGLGKAADFAKSTQIGSGIAGIISTLKDSWVAIAAAGLFFKTTLIPLLTGGKGFAGFLGTMKTLVSKVLFPLTIAIGAIQGVLTFMKNKDTVGPFEAFKLGFTDFVSAIIGWPVDIMLWLGEKVAGMFGLDFLESMLAEMNFKDGFMTLLNALGSIGEFIGDTIYKMVDRLMHPFDAFKKDIAKATNFVGKMFGIGDLSGDIVEKAQEMVKSLLKMVLPRPKDGKKWYTSVAGIASKAIPERIYEFAGIDKKTGEDIVKPDPAIQQSDDPKKVKKILKWRAEALEKGEAKKVANLDKALEDRNYDTSKLEGSSKSSSKSSSSSDSTTVKQLMEMGYSREAAERTAYIQHGGVKSSSDSTTVKSSSDSTTVKQLMEMGYSKEAAEKAAFIQQGGVKSSSDSTTVKSSSDSTSGLLDFKSTSTNGVSSLVRESSTTEPTAAGSNKMAADLIAMGYSKEAAEKAAFIQQGGMSPTIVKSPATKQSQLAQAYVDDTAQRRAAEDKQTHIVPVSNVSDNSTTNSNMTVVNNNAFPQQGQVHDF